MIRLTLILAVAIFAILVLVPQEVEVPEDALSQAETTAPLAPVSPAEDGAAAGTALREGGDGRLVLTTTTGERLVIDLVVEPNDRDAPAETTPPAAATAEATDATPAPIEAPRDAPETVAEAEGQADGTRLRVTGDRVNFRAGPSTDNEILATLDAGTEVELIERVGDGWAHLRVPETGLSGYMSEDFLEPAN